MEQTPVANHDQIIFAWRSRLARNLFRTVTFVSLPAFLAASWYALDERDFAYLPIYLGLLFAMLVIAFWNKVTDNARIWGMLCILYLVVLLDFFTEGRGSLARSFLLVFSFCAVLFFGRRGAIAALLISVLTMGFFAFAFSTGRLPDYTVGSAILSGWVSNIVIVGCLVAVIIFSVDYVLKELTKGITESYALAAALRLNQANLEASIQDRTAAAETARAQADAARLEAEMARRNVETQMWLAAGQAVLAEKIRGEQSVSQLADNIISQLSNYLDAQTGVLYLLESGTLKMVGSYAFSARPGFSGKFQLGEGLVGQAAADKRAILLNHPQEAAIISSGLIDVSASQALMMPFEESGQVAGVLELVTLTEFTQMQMDFLARVSESIGVAFRTAQARQRLADLLMKTQQQAEELQAQEEELRAANEELQSQAEILQAAR